MTQQTAKTNRNQTAQFDESSTQIGTTPSQGFIDKRPKVVTQQKLQEMTSKPRLMQLKADMPSAQFKHLNDQGNNNTQQTIQREELEDEDQVAVNMLNFANGDHAQWADVLEKINSHSSNATKIAILAKNFGKNVMGFKYQGASRTYSLAGDCGSLARTFVDIATNVLLIPGVKTKFYNGAKGWYLRPGFHEIDSSRHPNISNGGYYFGTSHVWVEFSGEVYDVLFGEIGQNGVEADERRTIDGIRYFRINNEWFKADPEKLNTYVATTAPE